MISTCEPPYIIAGNQSHSGLLQKQCMLLTTGLSLQPLKYLLSHEIIVITMNFAVDLPLCYIP